VGLRIPPHPESEGWWDEGFVLGTDASCSPTWCGAIPFAGEVHLVVRWTHSSGASPSGDGSGSSFMPNAFPLELRWSKPDLPSFSLWDHFRAGYPGDAEGSTQEGQQRMAWFRTHSAGPERAGGRVKV